MNKPESIYDILNFLQDVKDENVRYWAWKAMCVKVFGRSLRWHLKGRAYCEQQRRKYRKGREQHEGND